jgi:hypothetical protein
MRGLRGAGMISAKSHGGPIHLLWEMQAQTGGKMVSLKVI